MPSSTARMNSSVTRTELLAFWYWTETMSLPPRSMSKPASRSARILSSSRALVSTNSSMSGWSTSRTTILAARRVAPPDLMVPAEASAPRMNDTGPEAVPPEDSSSLEERIRERLSPAPEPPLKMKPSSLYQLRIESIESSTVRMKQLCTLRLPDRYSPDSRSGCRRPPSRPALDPRDLQSLDVRERSARADRTEPRSFSAFTGSMKPISSAKIAAVSGVLDAQRPAPVPVGASDPALNPTRAKMPNRSSS